MGYTDNQIILSEKELTEILVDADKLEKHQIINTVHHDWKANRIVINYKQDW